LSERRRIEDYPSTSGDAVVNAGEERRGSILSLWRHGKDKQGNDVLYSGERGDEEEKVAELPPVVNGNGDARVDVNVGEEQKDRRGSILSLWRFGKDRQGRDVLHSGDGNVEAWGEGRMEGGVENKVGEEKTVSEEKKERRGSILGLWRFGKDKNGRDVLHSGDGNVEEWGKEKEMGGEEPERKSSVDSRASEKEARGQERNGSILGLWRNGKDKNGSDVMHSGDGNVEDWGGEDLERRVSVVSTGSGKEGRGQERRGSILGLWGSGVDKQGNHVMHDGMEEE